MTKNKFPQKSCVQNAELSFSKDLRTHMDANSTTINRFKAQVNKFSGILSQGLSKTKKKFFREMLYGIQASKDVKLSEISRSLQEPIKLIKTENRLSRNLDDTDFSDFINAEILRLGARHITHDMIIAIDPGDINKPYAKVMEHLCDLYDGDKKTASRGYHLCQVTAANLEHNKIVPLHCELYSTAKGQVENNTSKLKEIITKVASVIGTNGIWAIDREGDNKHIIKHFIDNELTFVTRLKANRFLHFGGNINRQVAAERLFNHSGKKYHSRIVRIHDGKELAQTITYSTVTVSLPEYADKWLQAVIVEGWGEIPTVLITNKQIDVSNPLTIWKVVECYLTRWKCDECYRYIKQSYNTEDIRVRSYNSLRNMIAFVNAITYFTSIYMGVNLKLKIMVEKIFILSKRFFGIPNFFNYAMADGIYNLLKRTSTGIGKILIDKPPQDFQLSIFPFY
ncbi:MAG: hypothetical protein WAQ28_11710 [Bacteroidia bacterium]